MHPPIHNCDFTTSLLALTQRYGDAKDGKRGQRRAFCGRSWILCKDTSANASEFKRSYRGLDKVLVCLCRFWLTHRSLRARSVSLLGTAELHPELRFPKPHQTPRLDIRDAVTVHANAKNRLSVVGQTICPTRSVKSGPKLVRHESC